MTENAAIVSRRQFLNVAGAAVAAPMIVPSSVLGQRAGAVAPSDRVVIGGIGIGGRGTSSVNAILSYRDARFVAICDVRVERRESVKNTVDRRYQNTDCMMYTYQEELLAREDIDAVVIATPEFWHTPLSIQAAQAGKDVYCEKPCACTVEESQKLRAAFRRYGRIYQAGTQRRNGPNFVAAVEMARGGKLGKLQAVHANVGSYRQWPPIPSKDWLPAEPEPPKQVLDWDRWLGPSQWRPYNPWYVTGSGGWNNWWDFHGGGILEWGSHTVDLCQWAADCDDTHAIEYEPKGANGGPYSVNCRYPNGVNLVMRDGIELGGNIPPVGWLGMGSCSVRFEGANGWVETGDGGKIEVSDNLKSQLPPPDNSGDFNLALHYHWRDFIECIKTRSQTRANADHAANAHITCHAAFIAIQLGRKLTWDPAKEEFVGDAEANRMRARAMREPYRI
jgi:predicted dehydrogenase